MSKNQPQPYAARRPAISAPAGGHLPPQALDLEAAVLGAALLEADAQTEAVAFHDHFQSNGWRVGGKTPMADWHAAFRSWMRRRAQFQPAGAASSTPPPRARTSPKPLDPSRWS